MPQPSNTKREQDDRRATEIKNLGEQKAKRLLGNKSSLGACCEPILYYELHALNPH